MTVKHGTVQQARDSQPQGCAHIDVHSVPEFAQGHPARAVKDK